MTPGRLASGLDADELLDVPQPDGSVIAKRRGDLDFDDLKARARASADTGKPDRASVKEQRRRRELDWHRADLLRLRNWARSATLKYKPSKIMAVPPDMSFVPKPLVLLNSHLWRSLGIYERRFLEALEVEHCRHAGKENGNLILTYDQAVRHGIKRNCFASTRARLVELKLVEITHVGQYSQTARTDPCRYRLTYLKHKLESASGAPSYVQAQHDWVDVELAILDGRYKLPLPQHEAPSRKKRWKTPTIVDVPILKPGRLLA